MILLFAAHQGEEFVLALPAIMLVGAFFILRWANQDQPEDASEQSAPHEAEVDAEEPPVEAEEPAVQSRR
jgi:hypothetical protein